MKSEGQGSIDGKIIASDDPYEDLRLLRLSDVVAMTGISKSKVYGLVAGGNMPSVRHGRMVRVPLKGLREWIRANTTGGKAE